MAIDTKEKRVAVIGTGRPWLRDHLPTGDPSALCWRAVSALSYGGNALSPAVATTDNILFVGESIASGRMAGEILKSGKVSGEILKTAGFASETITQ